MLAERGLKLAEARAGFAEEPVLEVGEEVKLASYDISAPSGAKVPPFGKH